MRSIFCVRFGAKICFDRNMGQMYVWMNWMATNRPTGQQRRKETEWIAWTTKKLRNSVQGQQRRSAAASIHYIGSPDGPMRLCRWSLAAHHFTASHAHTTSEARIRLIHTHVQNTIRRIIFSLRWPPTTGYRHDTRWCMQIGFVCGDCIVSASAAFMLLSCQCLMFGRLGLGLGPVHFAIANRFGH